MRERDLLHTESHFWAVTDIGPAESIFYIIIYYS